VSAAKESSLSASNGKLHFFLSSLVSQLTMSAHRALESIKAGKRLPEARFENLKLGGYGQGSVYSAFKARKPTSSPDFGDKV
jgi:hypothetical protein